MTPRTFLAADLLLCAAVPVVCLMDARHIRCMPWQVLRGLEGAPGRVGSAHHIIVKSGVNVHFEHFVAIEGVGK